MKAPLALRPGPTRRQLRVLLAMLLALLVALLAFAVVALSEVHSSSNEGSTGAISLKVGAAAPTFNTDSAHGPGHTAVSSSSFRGTTTVLNFFASWCAPCREETPLLARTAAKHPAGIQFVGIDVNETSVKEARSFMRKAGVSYAVGADLKGVITARYGVLLLPASFLIGPDGRVESEHSGALTSKLLDGWLAKGKAASGS